MELLRFCDLRRLRRVDQRHITPLLCTVAICLESRSTPRCVACLVVLCYGRRHCRSDQARHSLEARESIGYILHGQSSSGLRENSYDSVAPRFHDAILSYRPGCLPTSVLFLER